MKDDIIVRAGAGAGKTTRLTSQVFSKALEFHKAHQKYPQMVVTTFTRKATQELRERLILKACADKDYELIDYVSSPQLFITTIHGVLSLFLKKYGHLVGLDNSFTLISPVQAKKEQKLILRKLVNNDSRHYELIEAFGYEVLLSMCQKYYEAKLINPQLKPFTKDDFKAQRACELKAWAEQLINYSNDISDQTENEKWNKYARGLVLIAKELKISSDGVTGKILQSFEQLGPKPRANKKAPIIDPFLEGVVQQAIKDLKALLNLGLWDESSWEDSVKTFNTFDSLASEFSDQLISSKKQTGAFEMADLELFSIMALRENSGLAQAFSAEYDYWLVDEYQDTSPVQVELLKSLIGKSNSFTVGDPQQSIYLFRGADYEVFSKKQKTLEKLGAQVEFKTKNYRSRPELLEFFNYYFSRLNNFQNMEPKTNEYKNSQVVAKVALVNLAEDPDQEYKAIAQHIIDLKSQGVKSEEICILGRTNRGLTNIALFLQTLGVPTQVHSSGGFSKRREVIDFLMTLKFLINPHDNENLIGLFKSPWFSLELKELVKNLDFKSKSSYWSQILNLNYISIQSLNKMIQLKYELGVIESVKKTLLSYGFLDISTQYDPTGRRESNIWKLIQQLTEESRRPGFNLLDYINNSLEYISEEGGEDSDAVAALEPNRTHLMTIHSSKGLEFDYVMIPSLHKRPSLSHRGVLQVDNRLGQFCFPIPFGEEAQLRPSLMDKRIINQNKKSELLESDRVLYVALTRAKKGLLLTWDIKVQASSPAARVDLPVDQSKYTTDKFTYVVDRGPWKPESLSHKKATEVKLRTPFMDIKTSHQSGLKYSVTSVLESPKHVVKTKQNLPSLLKKIQSGTLMHKCMEALKHDFNFNFDSVAQSWFGNEKTNVLKAIEYVKELKTPPIESLLKNGFVEWGFQQKTSKGVMEGQIDLWGVDAGNVWVVDYKSGSKDHSEKAIEQLKVYAKALKAHGQAGPFKLAVVYPLIEKIIIEDF